MRDIPEHRPLRYGLAVLCVALALLVRWLFDPLLGNHVPYGAFLLVIIFSARFLGFGPAVLAIFLGGLVANYFFIMPRGKLTEGSLETRVGLGLYIVLGGSIAVLSEAMRRDQRRLARSVQAERAQRERLRITLSSIGDAVIATDATGHVTSLNAVAESLTGWSDAEALGQPLDKIFHIVHETTRERVENPVHRVLHDGAVVGLASHSILISKDGRECPIHDSAAPIRNAEGEIIGLVLIFRDVADQRRAERDLQHSESRKASILESALDGIITIDQAGHVLEFNPAAEQIFGFRRMEVIGKPLADLINPPALHNGAKGIAHYVATGLGSIVGQRIEVQAVRADGEEFPIELAVTRISSAGPSLFTAHLRDITVRRNLERRRNARLAVTQILSESVSLEAAGPRVLQAICENLVWDIGVLWKVDRSHDVLRCFDVWITPGFDADEFQAEIRQWKFVRGAGLPGEVWDTGRPAWIVDVAMVPTFLRTAISAPVDLHAALAFPISIGMEFLGVIEFFSQQFREPDPDLQEMMATICGQISQFIERKAAEKRLRRSEEELADFFENASAGLHWVGADGIIQRVNQAELDLLGYAREEYVGHHIADFHVDQDVIRNILRRLEQGETVRSEEVRLRCKDGSIRYVQVNSNALIRDGRFIHSRCFTLDITPQKQVEQALKEADRRKDEFLAMLGHELRNPLAPIRNALVLLGMDHVDAVTAAEATDIINRQVDHMVRLVDDLLDVSRIMQGKIELRTEAVEIKAIADRAIEGAKPVIDEQGHAFSISIPAEPIWVNADLIRMAQVLSNLLNNAAKYTEPGGAISFDVARVQDGVRIRVSDNGIGIDSDLLPKVFDLFTQADRSIERSQGGLGIGLTLVRSLVEMHGGVVAVHSAGPGQGSEFQVSLPTIADQQQTASEQWKPVASRPLRVLVVEDMVGSAKILATMLKKFWQHDVMLAHDGLAALDVAKSFQPEIVLLDVGLPSISGYEVARRLRLQPETKNALLVALTGYGTSEDRRRALEAGFDEHLVKPASVDSLQKLFTHPRVS